MPWKECDRMSERLRFVSRLLDGEKMTDLCDDFGISRTTGYKLLERYESDGAMALYDQSRAPLSHPNRTALVMERTILDLRRQHPTWGAPKIKAYLEDKKKMVGVPAKSTVHAILQRHDLIIKKRRQP